MKTLATLFALTLLATSALALGETPSHVVLGPVPTPVNEKKANVRYINTDPECPASITASSSDPLVASIQKGASSKPSVLSHTIKLALVAPGTTTITVSIDFDDPLKADRQEQVDVIVLPSTQQAEKAIKVAGGTFAKTVAAAGKQAVKEFKAVKLSLPSGDIGEQDVLDAVDDIMDACSDKEGDFDDAIDEAGDKFEGDGDEAIDDAGGKTGFPASYLPKPLLLGACTLMDGIWKKVDDAYLKGFAGLDVEAGKKLAALVKLTAKAPVKLKTNSVSVARTPTRSAIGPAGKPPSLDAPPTAHVVATLLQPDGGAPYAVIDVSTLLPNGHGSATFALWEKDGGLLTTESGTPLDTHGNVLRGRFSADLVPGRTYTVDVSDPTSGLRTTVDITTPGV